MNDKATIFQDLETLVKMCRSKGDGASLKIEEDEIKEKLADYDFEIDEIKRVSNEESYDTSAEMADRNIEIITKRVIQSSTNDLKENNQRLEELKADEDNCNYELNLLKEKDADFEEYISKMHERIQKSSESSVVSRYNKMIKNTEKKRKELEKELKSKSEEYKNIQEEIVNVTNKIKTLEETIAKKQELLEETQRNLETKEIYVDKTKTNKSKKRIELIEEKKQKLNNRLEEIYNDPKYLELKIKEIINKNGDIFDAKSYLISLINMADSKPYMDVEADNSLEEELLRATQERDSFAIEIDQKSYNIFETTNPEKIRIEFLNQRIINWAKELDEYKQKVALIDADKNYEYQKKNEKLNSLLETLKKELKEYEIALEDNKDSSLSVKANIKLSIEEKRKDVKNAENIIALFRKDETEDIKMASKYVEETCEMLKAKILAAKNEIEYIKEKLNSKKTGLIDISAQNRDKEKLKELAEKVVDIKHRRQFAEKPLTIAKRLEELLGTDLTALAEKNKKVELTNKDEEINIVETSGFDIENDDEEPTSEEEIKVEETSSIQMDEDDINSILSSMEKPIESDEENELLPTEDEDVPISVDEVYEEKSNKTVDVYEETGDEPVDISELFENKASEEAKVVEEETATDEVIEEISKEMVEPIEEVEEKIETPEIVSREKRGLKVISESPLDEEQSEESTNVEEETEEPTVDEPIIEPQEIAIEEQSLKINDIFSENNKTNDENDDNILSGGDLSKELDQFINSLDTTAA